MYTYFRVGRQSGDTSNNYYVHIHYIIQPLRLGTYNIVYIMYYNTVTYNVTYYTVLWYAVMQLTMNVYFGSGLALIEIVSAFLLGPPHNKLTLIIYSGLALFI